MAPNSDKRQSWRGETKKPTYGSRPHRWGRWLSAGCTLLAVVAFFWFFWRSSPLRPALLTLRVESYPPFALPLRPYAEADQAALRSQEVFGSDLEVTGPQEAQSLLSAFRSSVGELAQFDSSRESVVVHLSAYSLALPANVSRRQRTEISSSADLESMLLGARAWQTSQGITLSELFQPATGDQVPLREFLRSIDELDSSCKLVILDGTQLPFALDRGVLINEIPWTLSEELAPSAKNESAEDNSDNDAMRAGYSSDLWVMISQGSLDPGYFDHDLGHSLFGIAVFEAFAGQADETGNSNGSLDISEIYTFVSAKLESAARPKGAPQLPLLFRGGVGLATADDLREAKTYLVADLPTEKRGPKDEDDLPKQAKPDQIGDEVDSSQTAETRARLMPPIFGMTQRTGSTPPEASNSPPSEEDIPETKPSEQQDAKPNREPAENESTPAIDGESATNGEDPPADGSDTADTQALPGETETPRADEKTTTFPPPLARLLRIWKLRDELCDRDTGSNWSPIDFAPLSWRRLEYRLVRMEGQLLRLSAGGKAMDARITRSMALVETSLNELNQAMMTGEASAQSSQADAAIAQDSLEFDLQQIRNAWNQFLDSERRVQWSHLPAEMKPIQRANAVYADGLFRGVDALNWYAIHTLRVPDDAGSGMLPRHRMDLYTGALEQLAATLVEPLTATIYMDPATDELNRRAAELIRAVAEVETSMRESTLGNLQIAGGQIPATLKAMDRETLYREIINNDSQQQNANPADGTHSAQTKVPLNTESLDLDELARQMRVTFEGSDAAWVASADRGRLASKFAQITPFTELPAELSSKLIELENLAAASGTGALGERRKALRGVGTFVRSLLRDKLLRESQGDRREDWVSASRWLHVTPWASEALGPSDTQRFAIASAPLTKNQVRMEVLFAGNRLTTGDRLTLERRADAELQIAAELIGPASGEATVQIEFPADSIAVAPQFLAHPSIRVAPGKVTVSKQASASGRRIEGKLTLQAKQDRANSAGDEAVTLTIRVSSPERESIVFKVPCDLPFADNLDLLIRDSREDWNFDKARQHNTTPMYVYANRNTNIEFGLRNLARNPKQVTVSLWQAPRRVRRLAKTHHTEIQEAEELFNGQRAVYGRTPARLVEAAFDLTADTAIQEIKFARPTTGEATPHDAESAAAPAAPASPPESKAGPDVANGLLLVVQETAPHPQLFVWEIPVRVLRPADYLVPDIKWRRRGAGGDIVAQLLPKNDRQSQGRLLPADFSPEAPMKLFMRTLVGFPTGTNRGLEGSYSPDGLSQWPYIFVPAKDYEDGKSRLLALDVDGCPRAFFQNVEVLPGRSLNGESTSLRVQKSRALEPIQLQVGKMAEGEFVRQDVFQVGEQADVPNPELIFRIALDPGENYFAAENAMAEVRLVRANDPNPLSAPRLREYQTDRHAEVRLADVGETLAWDTKLSDFEIPWMVPGNTMDRFAVLVSLRGGGLETQTSAEFILDGAAPKPQIRSPRPGATVELPGPLEFDVLVPHGSAESAIANVAVYATGAMADPSKPLVELEETAPHSGRWKGILTKIEATSNRLEFEIVAADLAGNVGRSPSGQVRLLPPKEIGASDTAQPQLGVIRGKVQIDQRVFQKPAGNCVVRIAELGKSTRSDGDGRFRFTKVPLDKPYTLQAGPFDGGGKTYLGELMNVTAWPNDQTDQSVIINLEPN